MKNIDKYFEGVEDAKMEREAFGDEYVLKRAAKMTVEGWYELGYKGEAEAIEEGE